MNIELSEVLNQDRRMVEWANRVANRLELSEEDKAISSAVEGYIKKIDKTNSTQAREALSELIVKIVEPEIFQAPSEILESMFNISSIGEFDTAKIYKSPKNLLIARESVARTGNVKKSYIDYTRGLVVEKHLQLETEMKLSDLRRQGAFQVAKIVEFAIDAFENQKFSIIMGYLDELITDGGENYVECTSEITQEGMDEFNGYLDDHSEGQQPVIIGLSSTLRPISNFAGYEKSDRTKDYFNNYSVATRYRDSLIASIKAGRKMGNGETLLPKDRLFGVAGKVGELYTKGELRILSETDINSETIHLKLTGVEFGFCITELEKIAKLAVDND